MLAYDVTLDQVKRAVDDVNFANGWGDNLMVHPDNEQKNTSRGPRTRFRLRVRNSREVPARFSISDRHTVNASWEAHRDVMRLLFAMGCTRINTSFIDYRSAEDFERRHADTYYRNAGSQIYPVSFGELSL